MSSNTLLSRQDIEAYLNQGETFTLQDGRSLGYVCVGDISSDKVVVYFNGSPSCRLEAVIYSPSAKAAGVKMICVDRPGIGKSDATTKMSFCSIAQDVLELVQHLNIQTYSVVGSSAGTPSALALMHLAGTRQVQAGALLGALGPIYEVGTTGMSGIMRFLCILRKYMPWLAALLVRNALAVDKQKILDDPTYLEQQSRQQLDKLPSHADRDFLQTSGLAWMYQLNMAETFSRGDEGITKYAKLLQEPWGFDWKDIQTHIHLYASYDDGMVPISMSEYLAKELPHSTTHWCRNEGHVSIIANKMQEALKEITS